METHGRFAPTVMIDAFAVAPPGWMWIVAFALGGCEWAIREMETAPIKDAMRQWMIDRDTAEREKNIAYLECRIADIRADAECYRQSLSPQPEGHT